MDYEEKTEYGIEYYRDSPDGRWEIKLDLNVGDTFYSSSGMKIYKCHVLAIVDYDFVVYKWYSYSRKYWHYEVAWKAELQRRIPRAEEVRKRLKIAS